MLTEAGVSMLYHTTFLEPIMDGSRLCGGIFSSKSGVEKINAAVTIDCTGDGDVAARAGVPLKTETKDSTLHSQRQCFSELAT